MRLTIEHFVFRQCLLPVVALQGLLARELGAEAVVRVRSRVAVGLVLAVLLRETESCFIFFPGMEIYRSAAKGLTRVVYVQFYIKLYFCLCTVQCIHVIQRALRAHSTMV